MRGLAIDVVPRAFNPRASPFEPSHIRFVDNTNAALGSLPDALLILIFERLKTNDLLQVAAVDRRLRDVVLGFNVRDRIRSILSSSIATRDQSSISKQYTTAKPLLDALSSPLRLLRLERVERNRADRCFSMQQEASWKYKAMPVLKADHHKMVLGIGNDLWTSFEGADWTISRLGKPGIGDISDICLTDTLDEIIVSFVDGRIERLRIARSHRSRQAWTLVCRYRAASRNSVEAIDYQSHSNVLLSVYQHGQMVVNWSNIQLECRPWCTKFIGREMRIATGTRSGSALKVHEILSSGLCHLRSYSSESTTSSVFAIEPVSDHLMLSGWYGQVYLLSTRMLILPKV